MISFYCKPILFNLEKIAKYIRNSISPRCQYHINNEICRSTLKPDDLILAFSKYKISLINIFPYLANMFISKSKKKIMNSSSTNVDVIFHQRKKDIAHHEYIQVHGTQEALYVFSHDGKLIRCLDLGSRSLLKIYKKMLDQNS